jgi:hypothetical protein
MNTLKFIKRNSLIKSNQGVLSVFEILIGVLIVILILFAFNIINDIHISSYQKININEVQDTLDSLSISSPQQSSLLLTSMKKLEDNHYSQKSHYEVNKLLGNYLTSYSNKNYLLCEISSKNQIILFNKGNIKDAKNIKTAVRNIGNYKFLLSIFS